MHGISPEATMYFMITNKAAASVTQMTESMWEIGRSKGKGERVHSQYNRFYWRDYQISFVDEEGQ